LISVHATQEKRAGHKRKPRSFMLQFLIQKKNRERIAFAVQTKTSN
jgi:hypothetical protein